MSWWTSIRDAVESVASVAGNYFYPGSGIITSQMTSKGSQQQLGSSLGQMAMLGTGVAGGASGNMANYGNTWDSISGTGTAASPNATGWTSGYDLPGGGDATPNPSYMDVTRGGTSAPVDNRSVWNKMSNYFSPASTGGGSAGATGSMPWGSPSNLLSMGSGVYGLMQAQQLKKMAALSDPWGTGGGAGMAGGQLQGLLNDPSQIYSMPGYQAGLDAVQRSMAAQGYTGSGNMMAALQQYGGQFYNNAISNLSGLARTGGSQAALPLQGTQAGIGVAGQSLASLGYGTQMTQPGQLNPNQLLQLKQQLGIQ